MTFSELSTAASSGILSSEKEQIVSQKDPPVPQYAVWYFVAATFVFAAPTILFSEPLELWIRITLITAGLLLVVAGGLQLTREMRSRRTPPRG